VTPPTDPRSRCSRRRFLAALGAASASVALAGCGYRPGGGDIRWREQLAGLGRTDTVDVAGSTLYTVAASVLSYDFEASEWYSGGRVVAIRTTDGLERWTERFEPRFSTYAVDADGVAAAFDGTVARFDAGGLRWRAPAGGDVRALAVAGDRVYARTTAPSLVVLADGRRVAETPLDGPTGDRPRDPLVAAGEGLVVTGDARGLVAFDPSGSQRWRRDGRVRGVTVTDDGVYVATGERMLVLDPGSGDVRWRADGTPVTHPPLVTDDAVYAHGNELVAFDRGGERRWSVDSLERVESESAVAVDDSGVYVAADPGLAAFDHDGTRRWAVEYADVGAGPFATAAGVLVVADGELVAHVR
jgi:outer membrane protein assembly factor BamB